MKSLLPTNRPNRSRRRGCLSGPLMLVIIYYAAFFLLRGPFPAQQLLVAHRGDHVTAPENTLSAFRSAINRGADVLEFDVQMTKDGALIVIHDETVDRTTDGTGPVRDLNLAEISALDAGDGEHVPTFTEVIQFAKENEIPIMPEAKSPELYPGLGPKMVDELVAAGYLDQAIIQSFSPETLAEIRAHNPDSQYCLLTGLWKLSLPNTISGQKVAVCTMAELVILNPWMLRGAHRAGQQVFVYFGVIEHPLSMRLMLALGVDGIMVDDTGAGSNVMGEK